MESRVHVQVKEAIWEKLRKDIAKRRQPSSNAKALVKKPDAVTPLVDRVELVMPFCWGFDNSLTVDVLSDVVACAKRELSDTVGKDNFVIKIYPHFRNHVARDQFMAEAAAFVADVTADPACELMTIEDFRLTPEWAQAREAYLQARNKAELKAKFDASLKTDIKDFLKWPKHTEIESDPAKLDAYYEELAVDRVCWLPALADARVEKTNESGEPVTERFYRVYFSNRKESLKIWNRINEYANQMGRDCTSLINCCYEYEEVPQLADVVVATAEKEQPEVFPLEIGPAQALGRLSAAALEPLQVDTYNSNSGSATSSHQSGDELEDVLVGVVSDIYYTSNGSDHAADITASLAAHLEQEGQRTSPRAIPGQPGSSQAQVVQKNNNGSTRTSPHLSPVGSPERPGFFTAPPRQASATAPRSPVLLSHANGGQVDAARGSIFPPLTKQASDRDKEPLVRVSGFFNGKSRDTASSVVPVGYDMPVADADLEQQVTRSLTPTLKMVIAK